MIRRFDAETMIDQAVTKKPPAIEANANPPAIKSECWLGIGKPQSDHRIKKNTAGTMGNISSTMKRCVPVFMSTLSLKTEFYALIDFR